MTQIKRVILSYTAEFKYEQRNMISNELELTREITDKTTKIYEYNSENKVIVDMLINAKNNEDVMNDVKNIIRCGIKDTYLLFELNPPIDIKVDIEIIRG